MFTRHPVDLDAARDNETPFGRIHGSIQTILNLIAHYSDEATLNPGETCEFPEELPEVGGRCLVFDGYAARSYGLLKKFGLLALIEIFRSELEFARSRGSPRLFERLRAAGHYPYSDLDREPVA